MERKKRTTTAPIHVPRKKTFQTTIQISQQDSINKRERKKNKTKNKL